ncbi:hypothetical protein Ahy_Scaffold6g108240 [Arachis hypogaea]|uniref:Uncharacterized protein n=1 Tax=Arachis hypogaea TaxID=3818 RepID=A0A444WQ02_ARAHY|nr:hypothetical protein Ahy_Scaffold6g108240 [Arachis hypogaea]
MDRIELENGKICTSYTLRHHFAENGNFQTNNFNEIFQFLILLCSTLCIPLSVEYIECTEMALTEFLLFVLTATLGGMFLCGANDLITIFVAPECFSLCSYLLSGYTKKDVRSNEATTKYLLMGGAIDFKEKG